MTIEADAVWVGKAQIWAPDIRAHDIKKHNKYQPRAILYSFKHLENTLGWAATHQLFEEVAAQIGKNELDNNTKK